MSPIGSCGIQQNLPPLKGEESHSAVFYSLADHPRWKLGKLSLYRSEVPKMNFKPTPSGYFADVRWSVMLIPLIIHSPEAYHLRGNE